MVCILMCAPVNQAELELREEKDEISPSCLSFPGREPNLLLLGADDGKVYKARLHDQAGQAGVFDSLRAHDGPLTALECHPGSREVQGAVQLADLFLTASVDWTVKLWSSKLQRPLLKFDVARDYVYDVKWCVISITPGYQLFTLVLI